MNKLSINRIFNEELYPMKGILQFKDIDSNEIIITTHATLEYHNPYENDCITIYDYYDNFCDTYENTINMFKEITNKTLNYEFQVTLPDYQHFTNIKFKGRCILDSDLHMNFSSNRTVTQGKILPLYYEENQKIKYFELNVPND